MEITRSAKKGVARAEKLEKIAKGIPTGGKRDKAVKAIGKKFYKQMLVDSAYQGEDYDQFARWFTVQKQVKTA